jgi:acylphosphatase
VSDKQRVEAVVHGRVQGVGYRAYAREEGVTLGVIGWVRNEPDGTVRLVAEADRDVLERLLDSLHVGPAAAKVDRVDESWGPAEERHSGFEIRR